VLRSQRTSFREFGSNGLSPSFVAIVESAVELLAERDDFRGLGLGGDRR
jgi:hypothetical protein